MTDDLPQVIAIYGCAATLGVATFVSGALFARLRGKSISTRLADGRLSSFLRLLSLLAVVTHMPLACYAFYTARPYYAVAFLCAVVYGCCVYRFARNCSGPSARVNSDCL